MSVLVAFKVTVSSSLTMNPQVLTSLYDGDSRTVAARRVVDMTPSGAVQDNWEGEIVIDRDPQGALFDVRVVATAGTTFTIEVNADEQSFYDNDYAFTVGVDGDALVTSFLEVQE